jgi:hypothetical protein
VEGYWIGVVSLSHIEMGVRGGYMQLNDGKKVPVQRLKAGGYIAAYSPKTAYPDGPPLQAFTALGSVSSGDIYQFAMSPDFKPHRVDVKFLNCSPAPIRPLIPTLLFIKDKPRWGAAFKFGHLKVSCEDFVQVSSAMGVPLA